MVADIEESEEMDASELHARRLNAKEVLTPMKGDNFIFPVRGEEQEVSRGFRRTLFSNTTSRRLNTG